MSWTINQSDGVVQNLSQFGGYYQHLSAILNSFWYPSRDQTFLVSRVICHAVTDIKPMTSLADSLNSAILYQRPHWASLLVSLCWQTSPLRHGEGATFRHETWSCRRMRVTRILNYFGLLKLFWDFHPFLPCLWGNWGSSIMKRKNSKNSVKQLWIMVNAGSPTIISDQSFSNIVIAPLFLLVATLNILHHH